MGSVCKGCVHPGRSVCAHTGGEGVVLATPGRRSNDSSSFPALPSPNMRETETETGRGGYRRPQSAYRPRQRGGRGGGYRSSRGGRGRGGWHVRGSSQYGEADGPPRPPASQQVCGSTQDPSQRLPRGHPTQNACPLLRCPSSQQVCPSSQPVCGQMGTSEMGSPSRFEAPNFFTPFPPRILTRQTTDDLMAATKYFTDNILCTVTDTYED